jgi:hypothetical protein
MQAEGSRLLHVNSIQILTWEGKIEGAEAIEEGAAKSRRMTSPLSLLAAMQLNPCKSSINCTVSVRRLIKYE